MILIFVISVLSITSTTAQSQFCNSACFADITTNGAAGYGSVISLFATNYSYPPIDVSGITPQCTSATYVGTTGECYDCCFNIDVFSEDERWRLLFAVNENLNDTFATRLGAAVGQSVTFIRYAEADHVNVDTNCANLAYPRICRLSLSNRAGSDSITDEFLMSVALDKTSSTATFKAGYNKANDWFGFAFSRDQINPAPMVGYGLVWSIGTDGSSSLQFAEYDLGGPGVVSAQGAQNLNIVGSSDVNGITTYEFTRAFETGNPETGTSPSIIGDFYFTGDEESLNIFAAVASASGITLSSHSNQNFARAAGIYLFTLLFMFCSLIQNFFVRKKCLSICIIWVISFYD